MKYSKWRFCDDFVKLFRCIEIFQSLSLQLGNYFTKNVANLCSPSGVVGHLVQNTAKRKARPALDF